FGEPVREILLILLRAEVYERQYRNRPRRALRHCIRRDNRRSFAGDGPDDGTDTRDERDRGYRHRPGPPLSGWTSRGWGRSEGSGRRGLLLQHSTDEAIAVPRNGFDVPRRLRFVAQGGPESAYCCIERAVVVDDAFRPEPGNKLLSRNELAGTGEQFVEDLQRLFLQSNAHAVVQQFQWLPAQRPV